MEETRQSPKEIDIAWFAGFFDGEGCIYIYNNARTRNGKRYHNHILRIDIANTDFRALKRAQEIWGTGRIQMFPNKRESRWRPCAKWIAFGRQASEILKQCLPYLVLKREQAEVAITFQEHKSQIKRLYQVCQPLPKWEKDWDIEMMTRLHELKLQPNTEVQLPTPIMGNLSLNLPLEFSKN